MGPLTPDLSGMAIARRWDAVASPRRWKSQREVLSADDSWTARHPKRCRWMPSFLPKWSRVGRYAPALSICGIRDAGTTSSSPTRPCEPSRSSHLSQPPRRATRYQKGLKSEPCPGAAIRRALHAFREKINATTAFLGVPGKRIQVRRQGRQRRTDHDRVGACQGHHDWNG